MVVFLMQILNDQAPRRRRESKQEEIGVGKKGTEIRTNVNGRSGEKSSKRRTIVMSSLQEKTPRRWRAVHGSRKEKLWESAERERDSG